MDRILFIRGMHKNSNTKVDCIKYGFADKIIDEPEGDLQKAFCVTAKCLKDEICQSVSELLQLTDDEVVEDRYAKFRNIGEYKELV